MWTTVLIPPVRLFPIIISKPISASASANSQSSCHRRKQRQIAKRDKKNQAVTNQLSGLDVLWALQKAADEKNRQTKKNRKREESESPSRGGQREDSVADYSNIRPLLIKDEWGSRLDELEKRLQQLSDTK